MIVDFCCKSLSLENAQKHIVQPPLGQTRPVSDYTSQRYRVSETQKSAAQHPPSQFIQHSRHLPLICAWLGRSSKFYQLCCCVLQAGFPAGLLFLTPALNPKPRGTSLLQNALHLLTHQTAWWAVVVGPFHILSNRMAAAVMAALFKAV